ncbi:MAG: CPBP family intramembrane metalloprotease [Oscillospiraceae bacterium]|nr:CPBP family intramembrane metalloprotease [Oscillospiraceae bacterium]
MKAKADKAYLFAVILFSLTACVIHAGILNAGFEQYLFTSALKLCVFILFPIFCYLCFLGRSFSDIKALLYKKGHGRNIKLSFGLGFVVFAFMMIVFVIIRPSLDRDMIINALAVNNITPETYPFVFAYVIGINAIMEEFFFRGFVFLTLFNMGYKRVAYIYSSLLFSLYHIFIIDRLFSLGIFIFLMCGLVAAGLIFNELSRRCKSVTGSLIVHISANIAINLVGVYYFYII